MMQEIICEEEGVRLDKFLSGYLTELSRTQIQELIASGKVSSEGKIITTPSTKTKVTSYEVDASYIKQKPTDLKPYDFPLDIVFEDEYLMVLNKPAGLTVHPGAGNYDQTLANALIFHTSNLSETGGKFRPGIVHRLDKDTSGLIIIAKDDNTHQLLSQLLSEREIHRSYLALVLGSPILKADTVKTYLAKNYHDHTKMVITKATGKEAITHYFLSETILDGKFSLLECKLDTGRTHQIRIHLNYKNLPIIGDPIYNGSQAKYLIKLSSKQKSIISSFTRQALHAYKLEFIHPITDESMSFEIDLPEDMKQLWKDLKQI